MEYRPTVRHQPSPPAICACVHACVSASVPYSPSLPLMVALALTAASAIGRRDCL